MKSRKMESIRCDNASHSKASPLTRPWVVTALASFCCLLWGSAAPGIKTGYALLGLASSDIWSQILFAGCRFFLAGLLVLAIPAVGRQRVRPSRGAWKAILLLSLCQTVLQYFFYYIGLGRTSGVSACIIQGTNVFLAILVSSLLFRLEALTGRKILGCVLGFSGVVLVNLGNLNDPGASLLGEGLILLSTLAYAFSSVLIRRFSQTMSPTLLSGWQFVLGGAVLMAAGFLNGGRLAGMSPAAGALVLYLAMVSAAAYTLWGLLLQVNDVSRVAVFGFVTPVCGVILSALVLPGEAQSLGLPAVGALILVCAGIAVVNRPEHPPLTASTHS